MANAASTAKKQRDEVLKENAFKPGQSGNPAGREKGSRNKLGEAFLSALHDDFKEHGVATIVKVREESPRDYIKVVASTLPAQLNVKVSELDELTDEQLDRRITALAALVAQARTGGGAGCEASADASGPAQQIPTLQ